MHIVLFNTKFSISVSENSPAPVEIIALLFVLMILKKIFFSSFLNSDSPNLEKKSEILYPEASSI